MSTYTYLKEPDESALEVAYYSSDLWVETYLTTPTHQRLTAQGVANIAPWTARICEIEGTEAHRSSADARASVSEPTGDGSPGGNG